MAEMHDLVRDLATLHPRDTARILRMWGVEQAWPALAGLPESTVVKVLEGMEPDFGAEMLRVLAEDERAVWVSRMDGEAAADLLESFGRDEREALLGRLELPVRHRITSSRAYPADTAGGMMIRGVQSLLASLTVEEAIAQLRTMPRQQLHYLYVVESGGALIGVLPIRELLLGSPRRPIRELLATNLITVQVDEKRDRVLQLFEERRLLALPVVDADKHLLGVITTTEALAAGELTGLQKLQRSVGVHADESAVSTVSEVVRWRLPWLIINLGTAFAAAAVVGLFEDIIIQVTALAVLLPVVSGQGGNSGSQSMVIVTRGLALREILPGMVWRVVLKEMVAGLINGVAIGIVTGLAVFFWSQSWGLALVIGVAMVVNMGAAALAGAVIPLGLRALGRDPAQASTIILTTVTDIVGFASFLGFAVLMSDFL